MKKYTTLALMGLSLLTVKPILAGKEQVPAALAAISASVSAMSPIELAQLMASLASLQQQAANQILMSGGGTILLPPQAVVGTQLFCDDHLAQFKKEFYSLWEVFENAQTVQTVNDVIACFQRWLDKDPTVLRDFIENNRFLNTHITIIREQCGSLSIRLSDEAKKILKIASFIGSDHYVCTQDLELLKPWIEKAQIRVLKIADEICYAKREEVISFLNQNDFLEALHIKIRSKTVGDCSLFEVFADAFKKMGALKKIVFLGNDEGKSRLRTHLKDTAIVVE